MRLSVIIPAFNEELSIKKTIAQAYAANEVIVVDCGSSDKTVEAAQKMGAIVLSAPAGRGAQMDVGAKRASGETLLFLHADTTLPPLWRESIKSALSDPKVAGGGFSLKIDGTGASLRLIELGANFRSRILGIIYGDQAIFVRRKAFQEADGFRALPLMEDIDLIRRLKKRYRMVTLNESVLTSPKRWLKGRPILVSITNLLYLSLYYIGLSPKTLYRLYYKKDPEKEKE